MEHAEVDFDRDVYCVMGLPIDAVDMRGAVQCVRHAAFTNKPCFISTPNLNFVTAARNDAAFRDSVLHSDLCLADGMPLVWVARLLGLPIRERISGAGLFEALVKHPGLPVSVYFFGGPEGAAEAASGRVNQGEGGLHCVGFDAPGFGSVAEMSSDEHIDRINRSGAQFVIVSLGAKKGQAWIEFNRARLRAPVICHLGAVVNFAAGTIRRAPSWMQAMGAEWLWRIKEEPGLWQRYWADGVTFIAMLARQSLSLAAYRLRVVLVKAVPSDASIQVSVAGPSTLIKLRGAWAQAQLLPLRRAIGDVFQKRSELVLDLTSVTHVDNAFIGLLLLARGAFVGPRVLTVLAPSPRVAATVELSGAGFLFAGEPSHSPDFGYGQLR